MKIRIAILTLLASLVAVTGVSHAASYKVDDQGTHAFIQFKAPHLGFSWLMGRFNKWTGTFDYDESNPSASKIAVDIDVTSVDSNHGKRDKHLRSDDFFDVAKFPKAKFVSTSFKETGGGKATLTGNLTIKGITKPVTLDVKHVGAGKDPWGGFRRGFEGSTKFTLGDFNLTPNGVLPAGFPVEIYISFEGIRM